ncbi:MAG: glycosyl transferase [Pseudonocardiales bacterium]|nr:MAG: glycosyl transferase [Pseudonocardiales bacterium]
MNEPVTVLQSFPEPRPTTNPYLVMLAAALRAHPGVTVVNFSWRTALLRRYDVFHVHWPEILVDGRSSIKKLVRQALTFCLIVRLWLTRTAIVRTVHNVRLPQGISWREKVLLQLLERRTTLRIRLSAATELRSALPVATILLGHYRDWYAAHPAKRPVRSQFGFTGLIRRYKGVERLIHEFRAIDLDDATLLVGGQPTTPALADEVRQAAAGDARITLRLSFLSDREYVDTVTSSELVVLPYRFMHNSSALITALSLGRPVLVPDNVVNRDLSTEVGPGWIIRYPGELTAADLSRALHEVRLVPDRAPPDLSRRGWERTGTEHVAAYRRAIRMRRGAM